MSARERRSPTSPGRVIDITRHKQAEEALAGERDLLRAADGLPPQFIYFKDRQSRFLRINAAHARGFGLSDPDQAIGKTDFDFFTAEHAAPAFADEQEVILSGNVMGPKEEKETWPDGRVTWASTTKLPLCDAVGNIIGTFGVSRDITERKRTEEELRFKTALLEAESETTIDGILVVGPAGRVLQFNKRFAEMMRLPGDIVSTGDDQRMLEHVFKQVKDPDAFLARVEYLYAHESERAQDELEFKDGRVFDRYSAPLRDARGNYYGRVWYFRDITARIQAEESVRESNELISLLLDSIPEAVYGIDTQGKCTFCNPACLQLIGYAEPRTCRERTCTPCCTIPGRTELLTRGGVPHLRSFSPGTWHPHR